jgi:purine-cytosine permease-like protein
MKTVSTSGEASVAGVSAKRGVDEPGKVEIHGVDVIPAEHRHGGPIELVWVWIAANAYLGIPVIGALPIVFGLGWWDAFTAIMLGTAVGSLFFAPMTLFGPRTGTTDPYTSRAHFGIIGGALAAIVTAALAVGFYALAIWTGGQVIVAAGNHLFGWSTGNGPLTIAMAVLALISIPIGVWGHASVVSVSKWASLSMFILIVLLFFVLLPQFNPGYAGGHYLLGNFRNTWLLSFAVAASVPLSYATFAGDYSRYFPRGISDRRNLLFNFLGQFVGCLVPLLAGSYAVTIFASFTGPFVIGLSNVVPSGFLVPLLLVGLLGTQPQAGLCLYSGGLSLQALGWRVGRVTTTFLLAALGLGTAYIGLVALNAATNITDFVILTIVVLTPFVAIMTVGFLDRRGRYDGPALQVFWGSKERGRYWFWHGVNPRAVVAFAIGTTVGMLFADTPLFTGPLTSYIGGVDISYWSAGVLAGLLYYIFLRAFPEPAEVYLASDPPLSSPGQLTAQSSGWG